MLCGQSVYGEPREEGRLMGCPVWGPSQGAGSHSGLHGALLPRSPQHEPRQCPIRFVCGSPGTLLADPGSVPPAPILRVLPPRSLVKPAVMETLRAEAAGPKLDSQAQVLPRPLPNSVVLAKWLNP